MNIGTFFSLSPLTDIPVFPTVTAMITLERYERRETPVSKYLIPRDYSKVKHVISRPQFLIRAHSNQLDPIY